jgi:hypothetical protein
MGGKDFVAENLEANNHRTSQILSGPKLNALIVYLTVFAARTERNLPASILAE